MTATYPPAEPIWCAGCGHFGVEASLEGAIRDLDIPGHDVFVLAGIGCSGTIQNNMGTYGYHALHGRVLPAATGAHLANPDLTIIATGGDGDGYAIGMGHLIHAFRGNPSFTYVIMNNGIYGLTKGQDSPTKQGTATIDGVLLGLSILETTFIARGFTRHPDQLRRLTVAALSHARAGKGFAFLEVLSPCVSYHDTYPLWESEVHDLDADSAHDPTDRAGAFSRAVGLIAEGRIPTGLIYRRERRQAVAEPSRPIAADLDPRNHLHRLRNLLHRYEV